MSRTKPGFECGNCRGGLCEASQSEPYLLPGRRFLRTCFNAATYISLRKAVPPADLANSLVATRPLFSSGASRWLRGQRLYCEYSVFTIMPKPPDKAASFINTDVFECIGRPRPLPNENASARWLGLSNYTLCLPPQHALSVYMSLSLRQICADQANQLLRFSRGNKLIADKHLRD